MTRAPPMNPTLADETRREYPQREIYAYGRYINCQILNWWEGPPPRYLVCHPLHPDYREDFLAQHGMGTWMRVDLFDVVRETESLRRSFPSSSDWRCPDCGCKSYARVDEAKPEGGFGPGPLIRCVNCKRDYKMPSSLEELREKIARALCAERGIDPDHPVAYDDGNGGSKFLREQPNFNPSRYPTMPSWQWHCPRVLDETILPLITTHIDAKTAEMREKIERTKAAVDPTGYSAKHYRKMREERDQWQRAAENGVEHIADLEAEIVRLKQSRLAELVPEELRELLRTVASVHLWRDVYPDGPDILADQRATRCAIPALTPEHIRTARSLLAGGSDGR